jgi:probable rRNA maturation factor|tara:strand:+ start:2388 stop:2861 length:474 start_codon:yes stop_codon:yes gene_type:complete
MTKTVKVDFFCDSKKWPRRVPKIKKITKKTIQNMQSYFKKNCLFSINLILSEKKRITKLNKKYKNKFKDTDVLTFVSNISNKKLGKTLYCDIFFSIDTIEKFIKKNNVNIYNHFNHLLVHSVLHINGYKHNNLKQFKKMKEEEIKILKEIGVNNPYL